MIQFRCLKFITIALLSLFFIFVFSTKTFAQTESKEKLKQRVELYYKNFSDGNYEKMWEMKSKDFRKRNADYKKEYLTNLEQFRDAKIKICIKDLKIEGNKAIAKIEFRLWIADDQKWLSEINNNIWVFEDNNWFYDRQNGTIDND